MSTHDTGDVTYEQRGQEWVGHAHGQRTMLKRSREAAQVDVANGRFVCVQWPACPHRDADACGRATARGLPRWTRNDEDTKARMEAA